MMVWWNTLDLLTQIFFCFALFFGLLFVWQFIMAMIGIGHGGADFSGHGSFGGHVGDVGHAGGAGGHIGGGHVAPPVASHDLSTGHGDTSSAHHVSRATDEAMASFHIITIRSVLAFLTLFTWYAALSLMYHTQAVWAVGFGLVWGFAAMLLVAVIFHYLSRLAEVGTSHIETCLGTSGTVYVDIPENGLGQVRCMVSDTVSVYQGPRRRRKGHQGRHARADPLEGGRLHRRGRAHGDVTEENSE